MPIGRTIRAGLNCVALNRGTTSFMDWINPAKTLGLRGEREAERFLMRQGFVIISRQNFDGYGEIDLIAVDGKTIVFVEVKTRTSDYAGHPAEAVDAVKQQKITRTALAYLRRHDLLECSARFDVIAILWPDEKKSPQIDYYSNAFEATGDWQMFS